jgi:hypothetical protein
MIGVASTQGIFDADSGPDNLPENRADRASISLK